MIELHIGDHACQWCDDVGRVQAAAHACLPDYEFAALLGEVAQGDDGDRFKKCRMILG